MCQICQRIVVKTADRGGWGSKIMKFCQRFKWMIPKANELISERSVEQSKRLQMRFTYAAQCGLTVYKVESAYFQT